jgi:multicomponent Na+:H+ antiporter subunit C
MTLELALAVGVIYAASLHLLLSGSLWRLLVGLGLMSHGAHLLIFTSGGLVRASPPLVREGALAPDAGAADPLPQALVLTAIVIAFAVLAFALVLALRAGSATGRDDLDAYGGDPG